MIYESSFIGLALALAVTALTGIYPGGLIVPSYLVLFIDQPLRLVGTWSAALATLMCYRAASRYLILFGRRRFVMMILIGGIWTFLANAVLPKIAPMSVEFRIIGWVIPGLVANHFERQGVMITTAAMITVTASAYLFGRLIQMLF